VSGICGIINLDGAPVDSGLLHRMAEAAAYRGPDGIRYHVDGHIGFAHLALHTTPESTREQQPLVNRRGDLVLVADARVDGRVELTGTLTAKGHIQETNPTDADLILAAYECWGADCPEHLLGDFAFVIWDKRRQRVFAARDQAGSRPFYYRRGNGCFQWATEAAQLLADPAYPIRLNEEMIAHDLAMPGSGGRHESYYQGIEKLGPADCLIVDAHGLRRRCYWELDPQREIRYDSDDEYAEHFGEIFRQTVRDRMRSIRPVGLFLSGGLDSASIAAVAADEMERSPGELAQGLHAVNWTFEASPEASEYEYSRAIAEQWGFEYHEVGVDPLWPLYDYPRRLPHRDEPFASHIYSFHTGYLETLPAATRPRVWMTGFPGDMLVGGFNPWSYWSLLQRGKLGRFGNEFTFHRRMYNIPFRMALLEFFLKPLLLQPVKQRLAKRLRGDRVRLPAWISAELAQRTHLAEWVRAQPSVAFIDTHHQETRLVDPAKDWRWRALNLHQTPRMRIWYGRMAAEFGAEVWNPWDDIRLVEYVLAIPQEQLCTGINHKLILRRAMGDLLPEMVRERRGLRTGADPNTKAGLRRKEASDVIDNAMAQAQGGQMGLLDLNAMRSALLALRANKRHSFSLWMALSLELWLQAHHPT
jgi:asparagine synthase (glutamine-hydrolysing)